MPAANVVINGQIGMMLARKRVVFLLIVPSVGMSDGTNIIQMKRWRYLNSLEDQHVIRKDAKVSKILSWEYRRVDLDFIAYEFLYKMIPHPDMFEIKNVLAIPKKNLEARHDLMLSIIRDRITNIEKYANERFSKFGGWWFDNTSKWPDPTRRYSIKTKTMNGCKHKEEPGIKEAFASSNKRDTPKYLRPVISAEILQTLDQS